MLQACGRRDEGSSPVEFPQGRRTPYATERPKVDLNSSALDRPNGTRAPEEDVTVGTRTTFGHSAKATDSVPTAAELPQRCCTCDTQPAALSQRPQEKRLEVPDTAPLQLPLAQQGYLRAG